MEFETKSSERVYWGRVFDVRRDQVQLPSGDVTQLDVVEHKGAVTLLPLDEDGFIWFVRQYRHAAGRVLLELPAGVLDEGETAEMCAHREIREEIGMEANHIQKIGEFFLAPGYSTEYMVAYLATTLKPAPLQADEDEFLSIEKIALHQAFSMAEAGEILDAKTLATLFLARPYVF